MDKNNVYKKQEYAHLPIGAHFSIAKGYKTAFSDAVLIGASAVQLFSKNPMSARFRKVTEKESQEVNDFKAQNTIEYAVIHASYLLNFARPLEEDSFSIKSLILGIIGNSFSLIP